MHRRTETSATNPARRWRLWLMNLLACVGLLVGFSACNPDAGCGLGEDEFYRQNPRSVYEKEQDDSAGQTRQRQKAPLIDEDAGDVVDTGDAQDSDTGEQDEPLPPKPGAQPR